MYINQSEISGWKKNGCGIACIAMVLKREKVEFDFEEITEEVLKLKGYIEGVGCRHSTLARVLTNRKIPSYSQEFTLRDSNFLFKFGIEKIKKSLEDGNTVIASVPRQFKKDGKGGHLVLLTGVKDDEFILNDPDYEYGEENKRIKIDEFAQAWRGFAIFSEGLKN